MSKKFFSQAALNSVTQNMLQEIEAAGAKIKKVYYCIHQDSDNCDCRKPKAGMFRQAEKELNIRSAGKYFILENERKEIIKKYKNVGWGNSTQMLSTCIGLIKKDKNIDL